MKYLYQVKFAEIKAQSYASLAHYTAVLLLIICATKLFAIDGRAFPFLIYVKHEKWAGISPSIATCGA